ncbi:hypothetical protein HPB52_013954 [Rhipicephalus sanguineus]|uniref:superoxide dismutase n=1 Tax=Rhipicephalus sanguineus TaxID=34632 RepID=A0A9D4PLY5_RHISA|nr:hypothetical protein HPB52_013954 [Rhipicephalus sanguineus]
MAASAKGSGERRTALQNDDDTGAVVVATTWRRDSDELALRGENRGGGRFRVARTRCSSESDASVEHSVVITGEITGLQPGAHGLHVHAYGDLTNGCNSTKGHFNPMHKDHGAPEDRERHVGDLGNIKAEADGKARVYITDSMISLVGHHNIIGRAMVVHANPDDLGKGGTNESKTSGSAGPRLACCVIGFVSGSGWTSPDLRLLFTTFAFLIVVFSRRGV